MKTLLGMPLICLLLAATTVMAQENSTVSFNKGIYAPVKSKLLRSAEKMPEESYTFTPKDTSHSFGQAIEVVAQAQYHFCSIVLGEKSPTLNIDPTKASKADYVSALKDAFAYCDKAYDSMTDASADQKVMLFGKEAPKLGVLTVNNMHNLEYYDILAAYLRLRNIVPPDREAQAQLESEEWGVPMGGISGPVKKRSL